jgi:hypothetical protein
VRSPKRRVAGPRELRQVQGRRRKPQRRHRGHVTIRHKGASEYTAKLMEFAKANTSGPSRLRPGAVQPEVADGGDGAVDRLHHARRSSRPCRPRPRSSPSSPSASATPTAEPIKANAAKFYTPPADLIGSVRQLRNPGPKGPGFFSPLPLCANLGEGRLRQRRVRVLSPRGVSPKAGEGRYAAVVTIRPISRAGRFTPDFRPAAALPNRAVAPSFRPVQPPSDNGPFSGARKARLARMQL